jgi:hypothetical protein
MDRPFDLWGWKYNQSDIDTLIATLSQTCGHERKLRHIFEQGGGKAFGLTICELLAQQSKLLRVPTWTYFSPSDQKAGGWKSIFSSPSSLKRWKAVRALIKQFISLMIRSSAVAEDWLDPASGTNRSMRCPRNKLEETLLDKRFAGQPVVVQGFIFGIGLVVDIGYSPLIGKVVGRVAAGRHMGYSNFTHATWDSDGNVGIWDVESGQKLHWLEGVFGNDFEKNYDYSTLIKNIYHALLACGIHFGVQLEIIIQPNNPDKAWLVQIRPTTELVRGKTPVAFQLPNKEYFAASPKVNGPYPYTCLPPILVPGYNTFPFEKCLYRMVKNTLGRVLNPSIHCKQTNQPFLGSIAIWTEQFGDAYHPDGEILALGLLGAQAVIGGRIFSNTAHASPINCRKNFSARLSSNLPRPYALGLNDGTVKELILKFKREDFTEIGIVSDGLVGFAYLEK